MDRLLPLSVSQLESAIGSQTDELARLLKEIFALDVYSDECSHIVMCSRAPILSGEFELQTPVTIERDLALTRFLDSLPIKSGLNREILERLAWAHLCLALAWDSWEKSIPHTAVEHLVTASLAIGWAHAQYAQRENGRSIARAGGSKTGAKYSELKLHALRIWSNEVSPNLSASRAAELLRSKGIALSHDTLTRLISSAKKNLTKIPPETPSW